MSPKNLPKNIIPYLFLLPAGIILSLTVFLPTLQAVYLSFTDYTDLRLSPQWIGWRNFQQLFSDQVFWLTLKNTLIYLIIVVPILVILPLGLAILVNQKLKLIAWFRAAYYTPVIISIVVAGIAWKWLYAENGLLNQLLSFLGFKSGFPWLTSPQFALFSVMAVTIWKGLGYYMVIYLAGLQSISAELYEAASMDGSDGNQVHFDITIPLMRPYLLLVCVISAISATKVFEEVYVMTQGGPLNSSKTVVYYLYDQAINNIKISYGCTIGLVLFFAILILAILNIKLSELNGR